MPEGLTWTKDQWKAIWANDQDILVAAAAGSGKTAVLVNRIINKLISPEDPINVDELLVVTFTNASAAEMRHRIAEALESAIKENPHSQHLRKQLSLINRASISTLHSFCLEVVRKYYYMIDIDPGFRIADKTEGELIKDEMLEELFEEQYSIPENEDFFRLVDAYTDDRSDGALQTIVRTLHEFARSNPDSEEWLNRLIEMYDVKEDTDIESLPFYPNLKYDIILQLQTAKDLLHEALALTKLPDGPAPRAETFLRDLEIVDSLEKAIETSWESMYVEIQAYSPPKIATIKKGECDEDLAKESQKLRDKAKKTINKLKDELFSRKPQSYLNDMEMIKVFAETLVGLVLAFDHKYSEAKKEKGIVDFSDLEHFCLSILSAKDDQGNLVPSETAKEYRQQFKEVLVDEYQDTNLVQETLLSLVTRDGEYTGNLFMVGDVKQSIYRFRLAEPNLFLGKYNRFTHQGEQAGLKIDLNQNFRSRKEVLAGTNFLFKQLMGVAVGEIEYDEDAELKLGAPYPEEEPYPIEVVLINQKKEEAEDQEFEVEDDGESPQEFEEEELETVQLEARMMANIIKKSIAEKRQVYDTKTKSYRSIMYRDMVILLRSMPWAPQIMEEFKKQGIPVYANLSTGYFQATEVAIMMSLLKIIDNPLQDIPMASVLRSPIVGLNEEELAAIKVSGKRDSFFETLIDFCTNGVTEDNADFYEKVLEFTKQLENWRMQARDIPLSQLIWQLYRETKFYDFVGGMPGGKQRQANLRALFDRARQYESSSFRGLFRFLRFIERMQDRGDDLGAARALGEQEDVVRLMTIHSSKGLEFPVVIIGGLNRQFNTMDLKKSYLLDKELGFASSFVNPDLRITYPSLPQIAFKKKKLLELIAEEMRVLYVALTRAKEKLYLLSTLKDAEKKLKEWEKLKNHEEWLLKDYMRATAKSYMDWIGPALARHHHCSDLFSTPGNPLIPEDITSHPSCWKTEVVEAASLQIIGESEINGHVDWMSAVQKGETVHTESSYKEELYKQLGWEYGRLDSTYHRSKQSVTELKRQKEIRDEASSTQFLPKPKPLSLQRPSFMQEKSLTPAERGTIMHLVMQHIPFEQEMTVQSIDEFLKQLIEKEFLTQDQLNAVHIPHIVTFFQTEIGQKMQNHNTKREVPFSMSVSASEAYHDWQGEDEQVLVQGVIDCIIDDGDGLILLDYKTDGIEGRFQNGFQGAKGLLQARYQIQINLYTKAIESIFKRPVKERYLFFFDGAHLLKL
ncbi:helicase-exonuclease AddAB subunit AddA [Peribacillus alkalitolerans]|uniref:helicase-exonuclease AddAB subunit AddA n=1 Tax=Peribacillus alkalitolerans TaxID=1550385 RepID=UPI0013D72C93|nr:helicase-exonuclease AddAB subunit AddA [Peribacillus alkalitolerans]